MRLAAWLRLDEMKLRVREDARRHCRPTANVRAAVDHDPRTVARVAKPSQAVFHRVEAVFGTRAASPNASRSGNPLGPTRKRFIHAAR